MMTEIQYNKRVEHNQGRFRLIVGGFNGRPNFILCGGALESSLHIDLALLRKRKIIYARAKREKYRRKY